MQMHPFLPQMFPNAGHLYAIQPQNQAQQQQESDTNQQQHQPMTQQLNTGMVPQLTPFPYGFYYGQPYPAPALAQPTQQAPAANSKPNNSSTQRVVSSKQ